MRTSVSDVLRPIALVMIALVLLLGAALVIAPPTASSSTPSATTQSSSAKWENEIAAFEAADKRSAPPQGAVLFVGSSTIRKWTTLADDFAGYTVINRGFGG